MPMEGRGRRGCEGVRRQRTGLRLGPLGRLNGHWGSPLHLDPGLHPQKDPPHLNDMMRRLVQARALELQARCVVARLVALFCHCLQGWQVGPTGPVRSDGVHSWLESGFSHLEWGSAYPRITESNPVFHTVPKSLKAQVGIITEVVGHAHVLPPAALGLEQLRTEGRREKQVPQGSISRKDFWGQWAEFVEEAWRMFRGKGSKDAGSQALKLEDLGGWNGSGEREGTCVCVCVCVHVCMYIYIYLIHFIVQRKHTQHHNFVKQLHSSREREKRLEDSGSV